MRNAELKWSKLQSNKLLQILVVSALAIAVGVAIGEFSATRRVSVEYLLVVVGALLGLFLLLQDRTMNVPSLQRTLLYFTIIAGFAGSAFFTISIGPIHLFPYRIFLPLLWMLFAMTLLLNRGRLNISHIRVKLYLQFLAIWLLYAVLSLAWASAQGEAIRDIIFLFMAISIIFFVVHYLSDISHLKRLYYLWLLVFVALIPIGFWETLTGQHLSVSGLAQTTHPVARFMPSTVFRNPNDYATYLALSLPFVLALIRYHGGFMVRLLGASALIAGLYLLVTTFSRANYLAVFIGAAFWFVFLLRFKGKMKALAVAGLAAVLLLTAFSGQVQDVFSIINVQLNTLIAALPQLGEGGLEVRFNLIRNAFVFLVNSFGFGVGAGNVEYHMANFQAYDTRGVLNVHNWWMEILTDYGLFIFVGYMAFYLSLLMGLYKAYDKISNTSEKMICEGLLVGLVVFFFASMSASSIMALRPQWIFFAFALAFLNYYRTKQTVKSG
jgi:teichuronic acid biosynthesis protein TuaE